MTLAHGRVTYGMKETQDDLVHRTCKGDRNALEDLFLRTAPGLTVLAKSLLPGSRAQSKDAEDFVAEAWLEMLSALQGSFVPDSSHAYLSFYSYVRTTLFRNILDHLKREAKKKPVPIVREGAESGASGLDLLSASGHRASSIAKIREDVMRIEQVLRECTLRDRKFWLEHRLGGEPAIDVANRYETTVSVVKTAASRVQNKLESLLGAC